MRLHIAAIGRLKSGPERELAAQYLERAGQLGRQCGITSVDIHEHAESSARTVKLRCDEEASRLLAAVPATSLIVALDERGKSLSSTGFAKMLQQDLDAGISDLAFAVGGPDGHGKGLLEGAQRTISFGPATWPHRLVRVMLTEQIYRAVTIMVNHPYHRA